MFQGLAKRLIEAGKGRGLIFEQQKGISKNRQKNRIEIGFFVKSIEKSAKMNYNIYNIIKNLGLILFRSGFL